jgi:hypothetical protein
MAKGEAKKTNQMIDSSRNQYQTEATNKMNQLSGQYTDAYNRNLTERNDTVSGYKKEANTGGVSDDTISRLRTYADTSGQAPIQGMGGNLANTNYGVGSEGLAKTNYTPQASAGNISQTTPVYNAPTGPSAETLATRASGNTAINNAVSGLGTIGNGPTDAVYNEFADTGGYDPNARRDFRARATSGVPAMYSNIRAEAANANRASGGYGPGLAANYARMARDQAAGVSGASRDAEVGLNTEINKGRQWGTEGRDKQAAATEARRSGALTSAGTLGIGQIGGANDANTTDLGYGRLGLDANRLASENEFNINSANMRNDQFGRQLELDTNALNSLNTRDNNQVGLGYAGINSANARSNNDLGYNYANLANTRDAANRDRGIKVEGGISDAQSANRFKGLGGMATMYGTAPAEANSYMQNYGNMYSAGAGQNQGALNLRAQYNPNVSTWDKIRQGAGMVSSAGNAIKGLFPGSGNTGEVQGSGNMDEYSNYTWGLPNGTDPWGNMPSLPTEPNYGGIDITEGQGRW